MTPNEARIEIVRKSVLQKAKWGPSAQQLLISNLLLDELAYASLSHCVVARARDLSEITEQGSVGHLATRLSIMYWISESSLTKPPTQMLSLPGLS